MRYLLPALALGLLAGEPTFAGVFDDVPVGGTVTVPAVGPIAKSADGSVQLRRIQLTAPGTRTIALLPGGVQEVVPQSDRRWFISTGKRSGQRFWVSVDAAGTSFEGVVFESDGHRAISGPVTREGLVVRSSKALPQPSAAYSCGVEGHRHEVADAGGPALPASAAAGAKGTTLYDAVVAVDTDNEFMSVKFANNTVNAAAYLDQLFAGMNVFYEGDLGVTLVRGETLLRVTPDPYTASTTDAQLNEVGFEWKDNHADVDRAFVMFLSGKSPAPNSASGIAWLLTGGSYCAAKGTLQNGGTQVAGHYSASQVFTFNGATAANDVSLVGHELGHNFGANHTHCTSMTGDQPVASNTIDQCFNGEAALGCYGGTPSCPAGGKGTIMSYCHLSGSAAAGCGNNLQEFDPVHLGVLDQRVADNIAAGCFTASAGVPVGRVFYDGFE